MMRKSFLILILVPFILAADKPKTTGKAKKTENDSFVVKLADGSQIVSKPLLEKIPLETSFAKMDVPMKTVQKIKFDKKTNSTSIDFLNGDKLQGVCSLTSIEAETLLGKLTISLENVTEILSKLKMPPIYNDSPAKQQQCINNLRLIDGAKEQWAMASNKTDGDTVITNQVNQYIRGARTPICPAGGTYTYKAIGVDPDCSVPAHKFRG